MAQAGKGAAERAEEAALKVRSCLSRRRKMSRTDEDSIERSEELGVEVPACAGACRLEWQNVRSGSSLFLLSVRRRMFSDDRFCAGRRRFPAWGGAAASGAAFGFGLDRPPPAP